MDHQLKMFRDVSGHCNSWMQDHLSPSLMEWP